MGNSLTNTLAFDAKTQQDFLDKLSKIKVDDVEFTRDEAIFANGFLMYAFKQLSNKHYPQTMIFEQMAHTNLRLNVIKTRLVDEFTKCSKDITHWSANRRRAGDKLIDRLIYGCMSYNDDNVKMSDEEKILYFNGGRFASSKLQNWYR